MKTSLLILLLTFTVAMAMLAPAVHAGRGQRQQRSDTGEFDEDEFSEFDNIDEEVSGQKKAPAKQQQNQPPNVESQPKPTVAENDDSFDELIEDEDEPAAKPSSSQHQTKDTGSVKKQQQQKAANLDDLDMEEFEHFVDEEEFEGFADSKNSQQQGGKTGDKTAKSDGKTGQKSGESSIPSLKITDVPTHLMSTSNWHNYVWEIVMIVVITAYFSNFMYGRSKNYRLVSTWYTAHRELLERNFALVGDNGTSAEIALTTSASVSSSDDSATEISTKLIKGKPFFIRV
jgi:hypothetical protein